MISNHRSQNDIKRKWFFLLIPFPFYLLFNNLLYNLLRLGFGGDMKLMLYGFVCETNFSSKSVLFLVLFALIKFSFIGYGYILIPHKKLISELSLVLMLTESLSVISFFLDVVTDGFIRFLFFPSTPMYSLSLLLFGNKVVIPIFVLLLTVFYIRRYLMERNKIEIKQMVSLLAVNVLASCAIIYLLFRW